ncbi:MAG: hypothetical protein ACD_19C00369G0002 [uncultured bacterium]|nr:MAG: hypothetical protein ACD_19C00369G0002 [uncultured bacterium]
MQNIITTNRIKIALVILITFFTVKTVAPNLFIANTPRVNPLFIANIINTPARIAAMPGKFLSSLSNFRLFNFESPNSPELPVRQNEVANIKVDPKVIAEIKQKTPPANVVFKYVSKGVSAAEDTATGEKYIKVEAGTKYRIVGEIEINGVKYPKIEFIK